MPCGNILVVNLIRQLWASWERRRPRHPHPEGSQGGVREAAIARQKSWPRRLLFVDGLRNQAITLKPLAHACPWAANCRGYRVRISFHNRGGIPPESRAPQRNPNRRGGRSILYRDFRRTRCA